MIDSLAVQKILGNTNTIVELLSDKISLLVTLISIVCAFIILAIALWFPEWKKAHERKKLANFIKLQLKNIKIILFKYLSDEKVIIQKIDMITYTKFHYPEKLFSLGRSLLRIPNDLVYEATRYFQTSLVSHEEAFQKYISIIEVLNVIYDDYKYFVRELEKYDNAFNSKYHNLILQLIKVYQKTDYLCRYSEIPNKARLVFDLDSIMGNMISSRDYAGYGYQNVSTILIKARDSINEFIKFNRGHFEYKEVIELLNCKYLFKSVQYFN